MWKYCHYHLLQAVTPNLQQGAAWMLQHRMWSREYLSEENKLKVYFMNECPPTLKYNGKHVSPDFIMNILKSSWLNCFTRVEKKKDANIRVKFDGM